MPQIGWLELIIIVGLAIVIIGPKDFPVVLKKIGSWVGSVKRYVNNLQDEVSNLNEKNFDINEHTDNSPKQIDKNDDK
tara:strand:- start:5937 stop:6170 length:234 start_codon:yes stop_codon:yes gene_type:complete